MGSRDTPPEKRLKVISFRKRENKGERALRKSAKMTNSKEVGDVEGSLLCTPSHRGGRNFYWFAGFGFLP